MLKRIAAFTLVELLVVIGIIALLISILVPALNGARQQALNVQCMSNLRQCGQILYMYAEQNKGLFPMMWITDPEQLPRNKGLTTSQVPATNTVNGITKFVYPDTKAQLAMIANPHSNPYAWTVAGAPKFDPGGLNVFYCPANWFWDADPAGLSHKPTDFMMDSASDKVTGKITYWYFGDPDPQYPKYHYTGTFNSDGSSTTAPGSSGCLDTYFFDANHNGDNRDDYVCHLGEKNMVGKGLMSDQGRRLGAGNIGNYTGIEFVHGSQSNPLRKGWTNVLFADGHVESRRANPGSFSGSGTSFAFTNTHPSPTEVQPRWGTKGSPEFW